MAVYREGYHWLETLLRNRVAIFTDAADFGVPVKRDDDMWKTAKILVEWYGKKETRKYNKYHTGKSVECDIELIDEWAVSDGRKTMDEATEVWRVGYVTCSTGLCKGKDGYIWLEKL